VLAIPRVPGPEIAPDKFTLADSISELKVPPDAMIIGVVNVGVEELAVPLDNCNVPEFTVVVPV